MGNRYTPLYDWHRTNGARFIEFHGWHMPVYYRGIKEEHCAVRSTAGLFDLGHMARIRIEGSDASAFARRVFTFDVSTLPVMYGRYTIMCNPRGGIIDDCILFRLTERQLLLIGNAVNRNKDISWLTEQAKGRYDVTIRDETEESVLIALQGPRADDILRTVVYDSLPDRPFQVASCLLAGKESLVMRTGYTGEDGFEVLCSADEALPIWETILYAGEKLGAMPAGLGARDTLRLEAAFPLYGNELTENRTPFECRLAPFIRLENENFIGRDALLRQKELGVKQRIIGVKMVDRGIPRNGYPVILHGQVIGEVTSGTFAPTLRQPIALAFVDNIQEIRTGAMLGIRIRGNDHHAVVCDLPFYKRRK